MLHVTSAYASTPSPRPFRVEAVGVPQESSGGEVSGTDVFRDSRFYVGRSSGVFPAQKSSLCVGFATDDFLDPTFFDGDDRGRKHRWKAPASGTKNFQRMSAAALAQVELPVAGEECVGALHGGVGLLALTEGDLRVGEQDEGRHEVRIHFQEVCELIAGSCRVAAPQECFGEE